LLPEEKKGKATIKGDFSFKSYIYFKEQGNIISVLPFCTIERNRRYSILHFIIIREYGLYGVKAIILPKDKYKLWCF
jgi:hypothetical protein